MPAAADARITAANSQAVYLEAQAAPQAMPTIAR
jgi:hypothetical protein